MRIVHVTDHYQPVLGGIETHVEALAAHQAARGDEVTVLTSTPASADGRHSHDVGPVRVRRARSLLDGLGTDLRAFDVIHVHVSVVAPFSAPVAAFAGRRGLPTVVTVHSLWNGLGPVPGTAAALSGLRGAPVTWTAVSRTAAQQLARRLPRGTPVQVLPNAVSVSARPRTPRTGDDGTVRLVSTMRVARRKRPLQLLDLFAGLHRSVEVPVTLTVVGDGPLRPRFERRVARLGLQDAVTVTGRVDPADVLARLAEADVYVAPAVLESFGLAALEARCVGLPVVGHAASGMTDFVRHGTEGLLCGSDAEMVLALRELVVDRDLRRAMSEHNRTTPSPLTWSSALERHDTTYAHACATVRARASRLLSVGER
ncbi:MAG: glycosyltransferase family 4 protein [Nocardioidaceae bacterium]